VTPAIELAGVGKRYWKLEERAMLLKSLLPFTRPTKTEMWAVRDMNLNVSEGETVGILGRNGAGKTTLLRLLAGVSQPSEGRVRVSGRIAPLISVGVGFHQEMSGRENVYVNAMLLGLTKQQAAERFDEIVAFAELADFIDVPVKFYSSGMFMRLGFAVAVHVDPKVLLVDEVLAVGDVAFQYKCLERMRSLQSQGATIVVVSHNVHAIRVLCPRALVLRKGRLEFDGNTEKAVAKHYELLSVDSASDQGPAEQGSVIVVDRELIGPAGPTHHPGKDDVVTFRCTLRFARTVDSPQVWFQVLDESAMLVYSMHTEITRRWRSFSPGETTEVEVAFRPRLGGGTYRLGVVVTDCEGRTVLGSDPVGTMMYLVPRLGAEGAAELEADISVDGHELSDHASLMFDTRVTDNVDVAGNVDDIDGMAAASAGELSREPLERWTES
jgi:ABC-type polysaccharide/polyol phosphate transport system ATPase subunit